MKCMDTVARIVARLQFTPAAQRAMAEAARWADAAVGPEHLLLGLLAESECRAASILRRHGVDTQAVTRHFSGLTRSAGGGELVLPYASEMTDVFLAAQDVLPDFDGTPTLATEGLLLGLVAADLPLGRWLRQQGLETETIRAEIHALAGNKDARLPLPMPDDLPPAQQQSPSAPPPEYADSHAGSTATPTADSESVLRVLDASANRAREGLRVIEDYCRFVLDDQALYLASKALRHDLAAALAPIVMHDLLAARDTSADVGRELAKAEDFNRSDPRGVAIASFKRVQEALRSLEEFGKLCAGPLAAAARSLRYRVYVLEADAIGPRCPRPPVTHVRLYVLLDGRDSLGDFARIARAVVAGGAQAIQLRDKRLSERDLLDRARWLRGLTREAGVLFIMNDRPDLAVLADADGVHVGQDDLAVPDARRIVGTSRLVGQSTHSLSQARAAIAAGADYIGVGPVFPSRTKDFPHLVGLDLVREVAQAIDFTAFAIGGICPENVAEVRAAGLARVAVGSAITQAPEPELVAGRLRQMLA